MAGQSSAMFGWSWTEVSVFRQSGIWTSLNGELRGPATGDSGASLPLLEPAVCNHISLVMKVVLFPVG